MFNDLFNISINKFSITNCSINVKFFFMPVFLQKKHTLTHTLHHLENRLLLECEYITYCVNPFKIILLSKPHCAAFLLVNYGKYLYLEKLCK